MPTTDYKFEGWLGLDRSAADGNMVWREFEPKPWEETDVDLRVTHSGICGTDLHTLRSGWYEAPYPICVGCIRLTGSSIGSRSEIREMLGRAADKDIKLWVQERPMSEANQGIVDFEAGKARYRYVLTL